MANINISLPANGNAGTADADPGDKITWTNNTGYEVTSFTLPTCVSPQTSPAPLANGATTRDYTVNSGANGTFDYSYSFSRTAEDTRTGTIDVGS
jgi:hypothetical protein